MAGTAEYQVVTTPTATTDVPAAFTGCHSHGSDKSVDLKETIIV